MERASASRCLVPPYPVPSHTLSTATKYILLAPLLPTYEANHHSRRTRRTARAECVHIPPEMPMATTTAAPTTAPAASLSRRHLSLSSLTPPPPAVSARPFIQATRLPEPKRLVSCQVAVTSDVPSSTLSDEEADAVSKAGARIRVTVPLKVYHVPKNPEVELCGMEGTIKQYVGVWKGKRISANLPFKVEFLLSAEGQANPVKFFAHLKEDEFEYLPTD